MSYTKIRSLDKQTGGNEAHSFKGYVDVSGSVAPSKVGRLQWEANCHMNQLNWKMILPSPQQGNRIKLPHLLADWRQCLTGGPGLEI